MKIDIVLLPEETITVHSFHEFLRDRLIELGYAKRFSWVLPQLTDVGISGLDGKLYSVLNSVNLYQAEVFLADPGSVSIYAKTSPDAIGQLGTYIGFDFSMAPCADLVLARTLHEGSTACELKITGALSPGLHEHDFQRDKLTITLDDSPKTTLDLLASVLTS